MYRAGIHNPNTKEFQLWQQDSHPIKLTTPEITWQKLNYVHNNPVLAGFTYLPESYLYCSARDYITERKGLVEIKRLDPMTVVVR